MGGEVLNHLNLEFIVMHLVPFGYKPFISIKKPLVYDQIVKYLAICFYSIQLPIDTFNIDIASAILNTICKNCDEFYKCHTEQGICWKEVMYAYGNDKWYYPDSKCHKAPPIK